MKKNGTIKKSGATNLAQNLRVSDNDDGVLGSGQGHVEPPRVVEKPDALVLVRADAGDDDDVLLAALEGVDAGDLDSLCVRRPRLYFNPKIFVHPLGGACFLYADHSTLTLIRWHRECLTGSTMSIRELIALKTKSFNGRIFLLQ